MKDEYQLEQLLIDTYGVTGPDADAEFKSLLAEYAKLTGRTERQALERIDELREEMLADEREAGEG